MVGQEQVRRVVTWVLAIALVGSIAAVGAIAINPPETTEPYTEFYLLGPDGNATDYPTKLATGESGNVIVGISNHEHRPVEYTLQVTWNGSVTAKRTFTVQNEVTIKERVSITAPGSPGRYRVRFDLYKGGLEGDPDLYGRLWVTVRE